MPRPLESRYPNPPASFDADARAAWVRMVQLLEQRDRDFQQGRDRSIQIEQLKDGVFAKSFTTVVSDPYYLKQSDGTILVDASASAINLYLTSAIDSEFSIKIIKPIATGNNITLQGIDNAEIDGLTSITITTTVTWVACDGKQWYIL